MGSFLNPGSTGSAYQCVLPVGNGSQNLLATGCTH